MQRGMALAPSQERKRKEISSIHGLTDPERALAAAEHRSMMPSLNEIIPTDLRRFRNTEHGVGLRSDLFSFH